MPSAVRSVGAVAAIGKFSATTHRHPSPDREHGRCGDQVSHRRWSSELRGEQHWSTWNRLTVTAYIGVHDVELVGPDGRRVAHPRVPFGARSIDDRHYLPELARNPQALRQVASELVQAPGPTYARAWRQLVDEHGPRQAARIFAQGLKAIEGSDTATTAARIESALDAGEPLQLALRPAQAAAKLRPDSLPASVRDVTVEAASAADFDALLRGAA